MKIQLSDHFTYGRLIRFTIPSIAMMIFISIYGVVDGFFVSNFAGKTPFSAVNLIMPFLMIVATVGFMFGTGGTALVAKTLGEGEREKANQYFSLFVYVTFALGVVFSVLGILFLRPMAFFTGGGRRIAGKLRSVWQDHSGSFTFSRIAAVVPELFYRGGKTPSGPGRYDFRRTCQYAS